MPKKLCTASGCRNVVEDGDGSRCPQHRVALRQPKRVYDHHYHQGKHIYSSARWQRLRDSYLAQNPLCVRCATFDIVTPATMVDHIIEIKDGGAVWDWDNLQGLCNCCHAAKTGEEKRKRNRKNKDGFPSLSDF